MSVTGVLRIHVIEANLTRDTELIGKMDPYVSMKTRDQEWKSTVARNMGKNPNWKN